MDVFKENISDGSWLYLPNTTFHPQSIQLPLILRDHQDQPEIAVFEQGIAVFVHHADDVAKLLKIQINIPATIGDSHISTTPLFLVGRPTEGETPFDLSDPETQRQLIEIIRERQRRGIQPDIGRLASD